MARLSRDGSHSIIIRSLAVNLTRDLLQKDYRAEACAILQYCRDNIRYVKDIRDTETLHHPETVLSIASGDCDDKSILLGSLLYSIGHDVRFIAVSFEPDFYCHVWVQDYINGQWLDLEPTEPLDCGQTIPRNGALDFMTWSLDR